MSGAKNIRSENRYNTGPLNFNNQEDPTKVQVQVVSSVLRLVGWVVGFHACAPLRLAEVIQHQSQRGRDRTDEKK